MAAVLLSNQKIIFTTACSEYALDSFEYHVMDYLLKPITLKRFMQALYKLQSLVKEAAPVIETKTTSADYLFVKSGRRFIRSNLMRSFIWKP